MVFIGQKMLEAGEQETAKPASVRIRQAKAFLFQEHREELLGQVLPVRRTMSLTPRVSVKRVPVSSAKPFQRRGRFGRTILPGQKHRAPMGRGETAVSRLGLARLPLGSRNLVALVHGSPWPPRC